ncbi:radical SAM protein [Draconibacterium halophilum]|uniref:Radical SAM protein n=1 Tax=Draconibacterium halophilum TaxID=2706887 RepID=A0A6C0RGR8_9BACT|nr:radical SAM protein [Draconibacterium halophilum]QIA08271.1 radical SAM protein [Draconibacterium halophilum]
MKTYHNWLNQLVNNNKSAYTEWTNLSWLNSYSAQEAQDKKVALLEKAENILFKGTKPYYKQISNGCKLCGLGQWSCLFITGKCNASCFYCPASQQEDHLPITQNLSFADPAAFAEYINHFRFKGVSFSGGEPLLQFDRTLSYLKQVRRKCNPDTYVWMYTNGILAETQKLRKLAAAGINEVRFDIGATGFKLDKIAAAKGIIPVITIEIPAVPEELERLKKLLPEMVKAGVSNLNLHQLRLTQHNVKQLSKHNYTYIHAEQPVVLESELAALELIAYAHDHSIDIGINYCSFHFKNRFQKAGFRNKVASALANDEDILTQNGYIRRYTSAEIGYDSIRIFDVKPERLAVHEFQLKNKTYYYSRQTVMNTVLIDNVMKAKIDWLLEAEPSEIPDDPLLFRIWQLEYIENGLREY